MDIDISANSAKSSKFYFGQELRLFRLRLGMLWVSGWSWQ